MGQLDDTAAFDAGSRQQFLHPAVRIVRAWITKGDGNWGFDEFYQLEIEYSKGHKVHLTDALPATASAFHGATSFLESTLGLTIDWRGAVGEEYRRYKCQQWLSKILSGWHRNKHVVYKQYETAIDK